MDPYKHQFVMSLLAYAGQRSIKPESLCNLAGLDLQKLKRKNHPTITEKNFHDLWRNAIRLTNDPLFGLHLGESLQLSALGMVGQIIQTTKTIGEALVYASRSIGFITGLVAMDVVRKRNRISVYFYSREHRKNLYPLSVKQFIDFFMVFTVHELDGLTFQKLVPMKASTTADSKEHLREFERVFRCRPANTPGKFYLEFDAGFWNEPIITANYEFQKLLLAIENPLHSKTSTSLREKVSTYLQTNAYLGTASISEIAANFNYTPRTLQRKLLEEGVTFRELTEEVRKSLALRYLTVEHQPLKQVASILGYNDPSALSRAFKRWTGKSPAMFTGK